jgi:uncharacterized membrane protein
MSAKFSDWKLACIPALGLLGIAAFILFVIHPGGFEGQIGWFLGLLPGAMLAAIAADQVHTPTLEPIVYWGCLIGVSFLWYFVISYVAIKIGRLVFRVFKHPS